MTENVFGVDVAKAWIDVVGPDGKHHRVMNPALPAFAAEVAAVAGKAVFEATGGCEEPLRLALAAAGARAVRVNPRQARAFARGMGQQAKTDRVDAGMLRQMGLRLDLRDCPPDPEELRKLKALVTRRRQLVEARKAEATALHQTLDAFAAASIRRVIAMLAAEIKSIEGAIEALMKAHPVLAARSALLRSAPGVGPVVASVLLAQMPELGALRPGAAASLVGVAPLARDSGTWHGKRTIGGGRKPLRDALFMAALAAARHDPALGAFNTRLRERGKAPKQAIIAVARKLVIALNAMIRDAEAYRTGV